MSVPGTGAWHCSVVRPLSPARPVPAVALTARSFAKRQPDLPIGFA